MNYTFFCLCFTYKKPDFTFLFSAADAQKNIERQNPDSINEPSSAFIVESFTVTR